MLCTCNGFSPVTYRGGFAPDENWLMVGVPLMVGFLTGTDDSDCGTCKGDANADGVVGLTRLLFLEMGMRFNQNICCFRSWVSMHSILHAIVASSDQLSIKVIP